MGSAIYAQVKEEATKMFLSGEQPTYKKLRVVIKGGSDTTVHTALKKFYEEFGVEVSALMRDDIPDYVLEFAAKACDAARKSAQADFESKESAALARSEELTLLLSQAEEEASKSSELLHELQARQREVEEVVISLKKELALKSNRISELELNVAVSTEKLTHANTQLSELKSEYKEAELKVKERHEAQETYMLRQVDDWKESYKKIELSKKKDLERHDAEKKQFEKNISELAKENSKLSKDLSACNISLSGIKIERSSLLEKVTSLKETNNDLKADIAASTDENRAKSEQISELLSQMSDLNKKLLIKKAPPARKGKN